MSAYTVPIDDVTEAVQESLADRIARGPLPLQVALRCAIEIAGTLRDMHAQGLVYGAVSSHLIILHQAGAALRQTGGLTHLGDGHGDVTAFGAVLREMVRREADGDGGLQALRGEMRALAVRCREEALDMKQVLIALRLLALQARLAAAPARRPALVLAAPVAEKAAAVDWLRWALPWRPLANLAVFALSGK